MHGSDFEKPSLALPLALVLAVAPGLAGCGQPRAPSAADNPLKLDTPEITLVFEEEKLPPNVLKTDLCLISGSDPEKVMAVAGKHLPALFPVERGGLTLEDPVIADVTCNPTEVAFQARFRRDEPPGQVSEGTAHFRATIGTSVETEMRPGQPDPPVGGLQGPKIPGLPIKLPPEHLAVKEAKACVERIRLIRLSGVHGASGQELEDAVLAALVDKQGRFCIDVTAQARDHAARSFVWTPQPRPAAP